MALPMLRREIAPTFWGGFPSIESSFAQLQQDMNRLLRSFSSEEPLAVTAWSPNVDIYEDDKGIRVLADVPGLESKDVDIKVEDNVLSLTGKREQSKEEKTENYHRRERYYGEFSRSFMLPDYADPDKIEATFKNGVLEVNVPLKPEKQRKAKHIEVKRIS